MIYKNSQINKWKFANIYMSIKNICIQKSDPLLYIIASVDFVKQKTIKTYHVC